VSWDVVGLLDALDASVAVHERDGTFVHVNRAAERLLGRRREDLLGKRLWDLFPETIGDPLHRAFQRVVQTGEAEVFDHHDRPSDRWYRQQIHALGERIHLVSTDITDRKHAELQLAGLSRASEALAIENARAIDAERRAREIAEGAADRIARLQQLTALLAEALTAADAAQTIARVGSGALGAAEAVVWLTSPDGLALELVAAGGRAADDGFRRLDRAGPLPVVDALRRRAVICSDDGAPGPHPYLTGAAATPPAWAAVPLATDGEAYGAVVLSFARRRAFDAEDRAFLAALAQECVQAILRTRLFETERIARARAERVAEQTRRLQLVTSQLSHRRPAGEVAETVLRESMAALGGMSAALWLIGPDDGDLTMLASVGYEQPGRFSHLPLDAPSPLGMAVRTGVPVYLASVAEYRRAFPGSVARLVDVEVPAEFATACVPLEAQGIVVGGLAFAFAEAHVFLDDERTFLEVLAHQCAQALDRTQLLEQERATSAALAASNSTLNAIISASPAAIMLLDLDGTVRLWNPAAETMFGWSAAEAVGQVLPSVDDDHMSEFRDNLARIAAGDPIAGLEARRRTRDGREVVVASWAAPIERPDGTFQCLAVLVDVTDRKRAEEAVQDADRRKDEFLAMLGHELRNPLAPIVTALQLIELKGGERAGFARERAIIERQTRHLVRLVDDLLDISRITRGKLELDRARVDLAVVLSRAVEMASPLLEQRKHHLSMDAPPGLLEVDADEYRLAQVFQNLLTNAAKFTPVGGRIRIGAQIVGGAAVVEVEDDGPGIAPDLLPVIFEPFVQGRRVMERSQGGLGLGLALVRSLVALHGGEVAAASNAPGPGSRFTVTLPLALLSAVDARAIRAAEDPTAAAPGRRVLLVDDNADAAEMLAQLLRAAGHDVLVAHDGPSALGSAAAFSPEVALLDIGLPVMDGYELARRLRHALVAPARLVALTGYGQEHDRRRTQEAGFEAHLVKPVDLRRLLEVVNGVPDLVDHRA